MVAGKITEIKCKPFPEYDGLEDMDDEEAFASCLATMKPGCVGDNYVHFNKLNHFMCDCEDLVDMRFMEFILTGMCHACQVGFLYYMYILANHLYPGSLYREAGYRRGKRDW